MKKNPALLPSMDKINETQRKSLGLGGYKPRLREENEALPISFRSSKLAHMVIPVMQAPRAGSVAFLAIKSHGVKC